MGGGNSTSAWRSHEQRFAPYIENRHADLINTTAAYRASIIAEYPYADYVDQNFNEVFFGVGYAIADFPSLYDMYGKFMAGFDVESLWNKNFSTATTLEELDEKTRKVIVDKDENLIHETLPEFKLKMRELGAVNCSSFIIGKAQIESNRTKILSTISADTKFKMLKEAENKFVKELNWNQDVIKGYSEMMKFYYMTAATVTDANYTFAAKNVLWPMEVLDFERSVFNAMKPGLGFPKTYLQRERSTVSKVLSVSSDTVTGAFVGGTVGNWPGAIVGGVIGAVVGIAKLMFE
jgi:hypothetical protein